MMRALCVAEEVFLEPFLKHVKLKKPDLNLLCLNLEQAEKQIPNDAKQCEILVTDPDSLVDLAPKLPNLKWVHSTWAGINPLFLPSPKFSTKPDWKLTRTAGVFGPLIAEFVIAHVIASERRFFDFYEDQKAHEWRGWQGLYYRSLADLTIGILGVGDIGKEVARVCKAHNMTVWGLVRRKETIGACPHIDHYRLFEKLPELLAECDFVCSILPNTKETTGLLGDDTLKHCANRKTVFINVGRGNILHDQEIVAALRNKWISGAILDVFEKEPLDKDSQLWDEPKVTIAPHISALSLPTQTADAFLRNYDLYATGKPLQFEVDWDAQY